MAVNGSALVDRLLQVQISGSTREKEEEKKRKKKPMKARPRSIKIFFFFFIHTYTSTMYAEDISVNVLAKKPLDYKRAHSLYKLTFFMIL